MTHHVVKMTQEPAAGWSEVMTMYQVTLYWVGGQRAVRGSGGCADVGSVGSLRAAKRVAGVHFRALDAREVEIVCTETGRVWRSTQALPRGMHWTDS